MPATFTPQQQIFRTALAGISPAQFARLRSYLDAVRVQTDARLAQIDAERAVLVARKEKLDAALQRLGRADGFEALRGALQKGEKLSARVTKTTPGKTPKKPAKKPAKRPAKRPGG